ncbi:MAG: hypothetical protein J6V43_03275, partial [Rikenellaceae bacterium]|nr:hypothetical protein [Rikenellaceae bacterium]
MKKFYSFLVAAVLLMGATSCQKEATVDTDAAGDAEFVASIAGGRTELGDGNKVMWNDSDNIRIFTQENVAGTVFNSNIEEEITATAKFTADNFTASDNGYLAVYPETANTGNATCENGVWSVPVTMSGWDGNPANYPFAFEKNAFMASFSNDNQLAFKAATAILKIKNVDNSWGGEIRFTGDVLGGAATLHYNPNNTENPISYTLGNGDSSVLYNFPEQNGETIYVPIYPGTVTGFEVYGDDWQNPLVTYNKTITFEAGVIYDLDLDNAGIGGGNNSSYSLFNGMQSIPMTIENGYHVAKNVPFAEWGYWIMDQGYNFYEVSGNVTFGAWMKLVQSMNTGIIFEADAADFYMTEDASMLCILPAGTPVENLPELPSDEGGEYVLLGVGQIRDDIIAPLFGTPNVTWDVEIYENTGYPGYIYLKNAYTSTYPYNSPGDYRTEDVYLAVNISDPNNVTIPEQYLGLDWNPTECGEILAGSIAGGTLKDGIITFPINGLAVGMQIYTGGQLGFYANESGLFAIALPGYEIPAAGVSFEAELYYISELLPSYSAMLPDYSSLCGLFVGSDIVSGGYALLKRDLGAYDPVSGAAVKSVVDDLCAQFGTTENDFFKPFTEEYIQNVNNVGSVTLWPNLAPSTA